MNEEHPLTLTVEQVAAVLGVGRSTAYELVHSGDIESIRLRRRIVVPTKTLAEKLAVSMIDIWAALVPRAGPDARVQKALPAGRRPEQVRQAALFTMTERQG